jgi:hypothetical protein
MTGRTAVLIAALAATLALPDNAAALDHVTLFVSPTKLSAAPTSPLAGWKLSAAVVGATSPTSGETFGISLTRKFGNGRGEEVHGLRAAPAGTVTFDGRSGRWQARFGTLVTIGMTVTATGPARENAEPQGCRGALATVPVALRGSFVLRTGTTFFGTIRRVRLAGSVTFDRGGPVDCTAPAVETCSPSTVLTAVRQASSGPAATLLLSPDSGGWMTLSFADRGGPGAAGATWYHVVRIEHLGFDPLSGRPPTFGVSLPGALAVQGNGMFAASETSTETRGACRRVASTGTFTGSFRTRFAGWGARTAAFGPAGFARFVQESA